MKSHCQIFIIKEKLFDFLFKFWFKNSIILPMKSETANGNFPNELSHQIIKCEIQEMSIKGDNIISGLKHNSHNNAIICGWKIVGGGKNHKSVAKITSEHRFPPNVLVNNSNWKKKPSRFFAHTFAHIIFYSAGCGIMNHYFNTDYRLPVVLSCIYIFFYFLGKRWKLFSLMRLPGAFAVLDI